MLHPLLDHSIDLRRLIDEGYEIEIDNGYALLYNAPYVNSKGEVRRGILVSDLSFIENRTVKPQNHVMYFCGEYPCHRDGTSIEAIRHSSTDQVLPNGTRLNFSFSNKPVDGYLDYYHKFITYLSIISAPAFSIDNSVTARTYKVIDSYADCVFNYMDYNTSRAEIQSITNKLNNHKIAIIGLGGTGSYILDLVVKTPVAQIHLFDGDEYKVHNAFRSPGAPSIEELKAVSKKTDYFRNIYSKMHKHIFSNSIFLDETNVSSLNEMDFTFICIDKGQIKKTIVDYLIRNNKAFIDTGIGVINIGESLIGNVRVTAGFPNNYSHIAKRISFVDDEIDEYSTNIQISDLNSLNAVIAVIKWKKWLHFYQDLNKKCNVTYSLNDGELYNEDNEVET